MEMLFLNQNKTEFGIDIKWAILIHTLKNDNDYAVFKSTVDTEVCSNYDKIERRVFMEMLTFSNKTTKAPKSHQ